MQVVAPVVVEQVQSVVREDVLRALSRVVMAGFRPSELQVRPQMYPRQGLGLMRTVSRFVRGLWLVGGSL